jgi:hypothetical protein
MLAECGAPPVTGRFVLHGPIGLTCEDRTGATAEGIFITVGRERFTVPSSGAEPAEQDE